MIGLKFLVIELHEPCGDEENEFDTLNLATIVFHDIIILNYDLNGIKSYDDFLALVDESHPQSGSENDNMNDTVQYHDSTLNLDSNSSLTQDDLEDEHFCDKFMRFFDGGDNSNDSDGGGSKTLEIPRAIAIGMSIRMSIRIAIAVQNI